MIESFTCPQCGLRSYNSNDVKYGYCGFCHDWTRDMKVISSDPTPGQRIDELHCWVATYPDGSEGILAGGLSGIGMATLLSSKRDTALKLGAAAERAAKATERELGYKVTLRLVTYRRSD